MMEYIKKPNKILVIFAACCSYSYAAETAVQTGAEAALKGALESTVAVPLAYVSLAAGLYRAVKEAESLLYPTAAEQVATEEARRELKLIHLKREFRGCLMKNRTTSEREPSICPSACEQIADMLEMLGEQSEVEKATKAFNHYRK